MKLSKRELKRYIREEVKNVLNESIDMKTVDRVIEELMYQFDPNRYGYFSSGGCDSFALALGRFIEDKGGRVKYYRIEDEIGGMAHAFIEYKGKYFDSWGKADSPEEIINQSSIDTSGEWRAVEMGEPPTDGAGACNLNDVKELRSKMENIYMELQNENN